MAQPPFAAPSEVASVQDVLLAAKLHLPRPRPDLVPRPRLAERLDEGLVRGLTLVYAPAGYGKTVLLADWARRSQQPTAWLSLDVGDNDPARFWRHGVAALDQGRPGLAEQVGPLLGPPAPSSCEGLVTALINELAAGPDAGQALMVLDDYRGVGRRAAAGGLVAARPTRYRCVRSGVTGSYRFILDFLAKEVLDHQSEQVRTFLLETSVLERLRSRSELNRISGRILTGAQSGRRRSCDPPGGCGIGRIGLPVGGA